MLGWMLVFALVVLGLGVSALNGRIGPELGTTSSLVFGFLLAASAFSILLRRRTR